MQIGRRGGARDKSDLHRTRTARLEVVRGVLLDELACGWSCLGVPSPPLTAVNGTPMARPLASSRSLVLAELLAVVGRVMGVVGIA